MTALVYVEVPGTNVHTDIGHGTVSLVTRAVGAVTGAIVRLDDGRVAYATTGRAVGDRDEWREIETVRVITRDEFDEITGLAAARREMGWPT